MITPLAVIAAWLTSQTSRLTARTSDQRGASLVEYALLVALIAIVCIAAVTTLGTSASNKFSEMGGSLADAGT